MTVTCNDPSHEARRAIERRAATEYHQSEWAEYDAYGRALIYPGPDGTQYRNGYPVMAVPCLICRAPIIDGEGHDPGCMGLGA